MDLLAGKIRETSRLPSLRFTRFVLLFLPLIIFPLRVVFASDFLLGGIQVNEPDQKLWVEALKKAGMNTVEVTVYAHQGDWDGDNLWYSDEEPGVMAEIRAAKSAGLHVALILRVALDSAFSRNAFLWHGMIMPKTPDLITSWFARYRKFVLKWAKVAGDLGVDLFGIASEMNSLTSTSPVVAIPALEDYYLDRAKQERRKREMLHFRRDIKSTWFWRSKGEKFGSVEAYIDAQNAAFRNWAERVSWTGATVEKRIELINKRRKLLEGFWRGIIEEVREVYGGRITYAANFDQYRQVGFWDALDSIGINAYFPLRSDLSKKASGAELERKFQTSWKKILSDIDSFRKGISSGDKPVIFTELGYTARRNSTVESWAMDGFSLVGREGKRRVITPDSEPGDLEERALAVRALRLSLAVSAPGLLRGILYWKLSTVPEHRAIEPFVLLIGATSNDPLLYELKAFLR